MSAKVLIRHIIISVLLIPILMFILPPSMDMRMQFHGLTREGTINVYRSDDAVGYYFRSLFRVGPQTTSAYMKGVHDNLEEFRVRFTDVDEIVIDAVEMKLYGLTVADMSGEQMAQNMVVKKGVNVSVETFSENSTDKEMAGNTSVTASPSSETGSVKLDIDYDGAYFILSPRAYMHAGAWAYYFLILFLIALVAAIPLTGIIYLCGFKNPISETLFFMMPAFAVAFGELACGSISAIPARLFFLNYVAILGIAVFVRFLTRRSFATALTGVVFSCIYIANHFVFLFRGRPLLPWDFQAVGTAAEVAGAYTFELDGRLIALIVAALFLFAAPGILKTKRAAALDSFEAASPLKRAIIRKYEQIAARICGMAFGLLLIVLAIKSPAYANLEAEAWDASIIIDYQKQGMPMTFMKFMDVYRVAKPEDYGDDILEEILATYTDPALDERTYFLPAGTEITTKPKRILMVMNESLSEISYAPEDEQADTLPFLRSLKEQFISGSIYVSVRGGGTCNTEFESLTASAMGLLPPNTYPYEAYLKKQTPSIASYFQQEGYQVAALHLADRKNWKRSTVYPYLGLESFYAYNDYSDVRTLRGYATDACDYEKLIEMDQLMRREGLQGDSSETENDASPNANTGQGTYFQNQEQENRNFIFNVTMQNHGGYSPTDDMVVTTDLSDYGDFSQAEVYYSLMKLSDEALRELIEHYQDDETDTMIVVYGDHQPSLGTKTDAFLFDEDPPALVKYETPFVIWANYDLPTISGYQMSANYLPGLILEAAGYELTPYLRLTGDCYQEYPVITSYGVLDAAGNYYNNADAVPDERGILLRYRCAQYNNLFDGDRVEALFANPQSE